MNAFKERMTTSSAVKNDQYWEQFSIQSADLDYLVGYLVESEKPKTLDTLAQQIISYRHKQLVKLMQDTLSRGQIYRPGGSYTVGEQVIFPHLGNVLGEVVEVRPGHNPEYDSFSVIRVRMDDGTEREFAAELGGEHPLDQASYVSSEDVSPEDLYEQYGAGVKELLLQTLKDDSNFVSVGYQWFVRDLLVDISAGQLNIAEALLDMNGGGTLRTVDFLDDIDLPAEIPESLRLFSLEYALLNDQRFDEVGPSGGALWYLRRMEPEGVLESPVHLRYMPIPYNRGLIDDMMLPLERQVDDEWSEVANDKDIPEEDPITVVLSYPHWRSGTLPLTPRLSQLFPTARITDRIRFTFVDAANGDEFPGWVVLSNRYVYGLSKWYAEQRVGVGSFVDLRPGEELGTIEVSVRPFRARRGEWLRTVSVEDGHLAFEVTRVPVACEFDELAAIAVPDPESVDALAREMRRVSLESLVERVFRELAVLSLQRAVHAMTLYSVINLVRRVPPAPLLAVLAMAPQYISLGDNYWAYRGEN